MKPKTLEDALFDTGAPDEIILLAMIEACLQLKEFRVSVTYSYTSPFSSIMNWFYTQQGVDFWGSINELYQIRTP